VSESIKLELSPTEFMVIFRLVTEARNSSTEEQWRELIGAPDRGPQRQSTMSAATRVISKLWRIVKESGA